MLIWMKLNVTPKRLCIPNSTKTTVLCLCFHILHRKRHWNCIKHTQERVFQSKKNNVLSCTTVRNILIDLLIIIFIFVTYLLICENNKISTLNARLVEQRAPALLKRWTLDNVITLTSDDSRNIGDDSRYSMDVSRTCANRSLLCANHL